MIQAVSTILLLKTVVWAATLPRCPPSGPIFPLPDLSTVIDSGDLTWQIKTLLQSNETSWNASTTSFSVEVTSVEKTIYAHHHTAKVHNTTGTSNVDTNTVYRIASITKVFASLALLLETPWAVDAPARWFVPELGLLRGYEEITLRMLASQMSGIPRDGYAFDWYGEAGERLQEGGFPDPAKQDIPTCDGIGLPACSRKDFFEILQGQQLSWNVNDCPAYSDLAYIILGFAMEAITGKSFDTIIQDSISVPLELSETGIESPDLSKAIIPNGIAGVFMGYDIANFNSAAGLYSTPRDVTALVRSILNNTLLTPTQTRRWMKPDTFAGGLSTAVGMPWEIFRLSGLTSEGRPVDVYTKSGDIPGYSAEVMLFPDYGIGATILVSGEDAYTATVDLMDMLATYLIPTADRTAREQADKIYAGTYVRNANGAAARLDLEVDEGPGLKITEWMNANKSILNTLADYKGIPIQNLDARIYPIGEESRWRLQLENTKYNLDENPSKPSQMCRAWFQVDQYRYAGKAVDEFTFTFEEGLAQNVHNAGLRATMSKVDANR